MRIWGSVLTSGFLFFTAGCSSQAGEEEGAMNGLENDSVDTSADSLCQSAGWDAASRPVAVGFDEQSLVLVNADGERRRIHTFVLPEGRAPWEMSMALSTHDGRITASASARQTYLEGESGGETVRFRKTGELVWRLPGIAVVQSDTGMGARVQGIPMTVTADGATHEIPVPGWDSFDFLQAPDDAGWIDSRWTTFVNGERQEHFGAVNLDGHRFRETGRPTPTDAMGSLTAGEWKLELDGDYVPAWLVHLPSQDRAAVRTLAPRRPLSGAYCNPPTLLEDGRIGLGMRNDDTAGFFVGGADGADWTQIGASVRDVTAITGQRIGTTWVLTTNSGKQSYCPSFEPFPDNDAVPAGDSLQLVADGEDPLVFGSPSPFELGYVSVHSTGACAYRQIGIQSTSEAQVFDLHAGTHRIVDPLVAFTWL